MADAIPHIGAMLQSARELTLEAANSVASRLIDDAPISNSDIERYLNARTDRERLAGLRQVISLMCRGKNALPFFAGVIKNVASTNSQVRKLVYIYLVRYAAHEQDLALLSINTIQKALTDDSPVIRALAMRVISGIKVLTIVQIIALGIKKCVSDPSPVVRRAAAAAITKCYELDASNGPTLLQHLKKLLGDRDPHVVGSAFITLQRSFPDRVDILHPIFRKACSQLPAMGEWGQQAALDSFLKYARIYFRRPEIVKAKAVDRDEYSQLEDDEDEYDTLAITTDATDSLVLDSNTSTENQVALDSDLQLLFNSTYPLLFSRNGSVVISACNIYFYLGLPQHFAEYNVAGHVIELLRADIGVQYLALTNIKVMTLNEARAELFVPFLKHFFVLPCDVYMISKLKIEIMTLLKNQTNENTVINELKYYALTSNDQKIIASAVQAIGRTVSSESVTDSSRILGWLLCQVASSVPGGSSRLFAGSANKAFPTRSTGKPTFVSECLNVIRNLILRNPTGHISTIRRLARLIDFVSVPEVRASLVWLVGEFVGIAPEIAPDVLRKCVKNFKREEKEVRYQIVVLAAKVYSYWVDEKNKERDARGEFTYDEHEGFANHEEKEIIPKLFSYVIHLARYDSDYDTRDRARMFNALLVGNGGNNTQLGTLLLQAPKVCPITSLREIMCGSSKPPSRLGTSGVSVTASGGSIGVKEASLHSASDLLKQHVHKDGVEEFVDSDDDSSDIQTSPDKEFSNAFANISSNTNDLSSEGDNLAGGIPLARLTLGSTSLALGHPVDGFTSLPAWTPADQALLEDPSVRDELIPTAGAGSSGMLSSTGTNLGRYGQSSGFGGGVPTAISSSSSVSARSGGFVAKNGNEVVTASSKMAALADAQRKSKLKEQTLDEFFADVDEEESSEEEDSSEEESSEEEESGEEESGSEAGSEEDEEEEDDDDESEEEGEEEDESNDDGNESEEEDSAETGLLKK